jgi:hypothetical protein
MTASDFLLSRARNALLAGLFGALVLAPSFAPALAREPRVVFEQPALNEAAKHAYVKKKPKRGNFYLVLWQPNPHRPDGGLVPVTWRVGDKTGYYPSGPLARHQLGMRDAYGSTALQIEGDTVGAYLSSTDLTHGAAWHKNMITPAYDFPRAAQIAPFHGSDSALTCALELQVPTAVDGSGRKSAAYVNLDLMFARNDETARMTYNGGLFYNHPEDAPPERVGFDPATQTVAVLTPIRPGSKWNKYTRGTEAQQGAPWTGWKKFRFTITRDNFASALKAVREKHRGTTWGDDPSEWKLTLIHLNAEIRYETAAAELGWSMRRLKCAAT